MDFLPCPTEKLYKGPEFFLLACLLGNLMCAAFSVGFLVPPRLAEQLGGVDIVTLLLIKFLIICCLVAIELWFRSWGLKSTESFRTEESPVLLSKDSVSTCCSEVWEWSPWDLRFSGKWWCPVVFISFTVLFRETHFVSEGGISLLSCSHSSQCSHSMELLPVDSASQCWVLSVEMDASFDFLLGALSPGIFIAGAATSGCFSFPFPLGFIIKLDLTSFLFAIPALRESTTLRVSTHLTKVSTVSTWHTKGRLLYFSIFILYFCIIVFFLWKLIGPSYDVY